MARRRPLKTFAVSRSDDDQSFAQLRRAVVGSVEHPNVRRVADAFELRDDYVQRPTTLRFADRLAAPTASTADQSQRVAPPTNVVRARFEGNNLSVTTASAF